jgi:hypothetical protein
MNQSVALDLSETRAAAQQRRPTGAPPHGRAELLLCPFCSIPPQKLHAASTASFNRSRYAERGSNTAPSCVVTGVAI